MDINELSGWGISQHIADVVENGFSYNEETGEVYFTTDDLDALKEALDDKLESLSGLYQKYTSNAEALKNRAKDVMKQSKALESKADHIKRYIDTLMRINGKEKVQVGDKTISYRRSVSSNIIDEEALRNYINSNDELKNKYYVYKEPEISKKTLSDDIKSTKQEDGSYTLTIPGFELVENKNLIIK